MDLWWLLLGHVLHLDFQEVELGREGQGIAIRHKCVVSFILRVDIINHQLVTPPHVGDGDPLAGPHLDPILVPLARDLLIRHLTLEHRLFRGLHRQICNALQDLQLFLFHNELGLTLAAISHDLVVTLILQGDF